MQMLRGMSVYSLCRYCAAELKPSSTSLSLDLLQRKLPLSGTVTASHTAPDLHRGGARDEDVRARQARE